MYTSDNVTHVIEADVCVQDMPILYNHLYLNTFSR